MRNVDAGTCFRGFGAQGAGDAHVTSLDEYARDVLAILDARNINRAVIAGVSMGGYVAVPEAFNAVLQRFLHSLGQ